ncbi:metallophosphoesterase [Hydrogenophaga sp. ANAO-22]|uniref:metallophosphoesterase family protein n=1 Tax=Hydrogenophaga sp. ANAO-22 TaxID=3166645 RepID=UPI0036D34178
MILFCGDPHGQFNHILLAAEETQAQAVVLLGDLEAPAPLSELLAPIREITWLIHGNHDTDAETSFRHLWLDEMGARNLDGQVVTLPGGLRVAGLGGVFREAVWHPDPGSKLQGKPVFASAKEHAARTPRQDRCEGRQHRRHWSSIYPDVVDQLAGMRADVLVTHEAPGYHPYGFEILDTLAQQMGVKKLVHGHQHDRQDSSGRWEQQGFQSFGVGFRGITGLTAAGEMVVIRPGEFDHR